MKTEHPVILFDGVCNLCNGAVQFIVKRDHRGRFRFASLQSAFGKEQCEQFSLPTDRLYSILLIKKGKVYDRSDAILEITKDLRGIWPVLSFFKILPKVFRDAVYDMISRNRYRWFGRKDTCMIPTPELKARFLDQ